MSDWSISPSVRTHFLYRLIWKNWMEIWPIALGLWAILVLMISVVAGKSPPSVDGPLVSGVFPIIVSLLIPGLAIAQERQTGSWLWNSSLPCRPSWHFWGWLITWCLLVVPGWLSLLLLESWLLNGPSEGGTGVWDIDRLCSIALIAMETLAIITATSLWFRDPLQSLCVGGLVVFVKHGGILLAMERWERWLGTETEYWVADPMYWLMNGGSILFWSVLAARLYGWRWIQGQFFQVALQYYFYQMNLVPSRNASWDFSVLDNRYGINAVARTIWFFRNAHLQIIFIAVLVHGLGTATWFWLGEFYTSRFMGFENAAMQLFVIAAILGIHAGNCLLRQDSYRFLSERGLSSWPIVDLCFFGNLTTLTLLYMAMRWFSGLESNEISVFWFPCMVAVHSIAFWSGLNWQNSIPAIGGTLLVIFLTFTVTVAIINGPNRWPQLIWLAVPWALYGWTTAKALVWHRWSYGTIDWKVSAESAAVIFVSAILSSSYSPAAFVILSFFAIVNGRRLLKMAT